MQDSALLRLPVEIRLQIYHLVIGNGLVHVISKRNHVFCAWCTDPARHSIESFSLCDVINASSGVLREVDEIPEFGWGGSSDMIPKPDAALLRVCRQVHIEALPVLYANATFQFSDLDAWLWMCGRLGDDSVALIRRLHVLLYFIPGMYPADSPSMRSRIVIRESEVYDPFWTLVRTKMLGLTDLVVDVCLDWRVAPRTSDAQWCQPIKALRGLKAFELKISDVTPPRDTSAAAEKLALEGYLRDIVCGERGEVVHTGHAG